MSKKAGRNDPCPCGSGKKFKQCCQKLPGRKKLSAKVIKSGAAAEQGEKQKGQGSDLIKRAFGNAFAAPAPTLKEEPKESSESKAQE